MNKSDRDFDRRSQLIVYHFMLGPGWVEGCDACSFLVDHIDGAPYTLSITMYRWWSCHARTCARSSA
ncbi:MAG TPA: DUF899 family protein [Chthoniobacterales bacterium]|nr:DUF899 family protein [Chthoniobacterales bacterium]